jgi:hypothetical protein
MSLIIKGRGRRRVEWLCVEDMRGSGNVGFLKERDLSVLQL